MDEHPLRGLLRWAGLPLFCGIAGALAGLLSVLTVAGEGAANTTLMGAVIGLGAGLSSALSSRWWLNMLLSPLVGWMVIAIYFFVETIPASSPMGPALVLLLLWLPQMRIFMVLLTVPVTAMHAWRCTRLRPRLALGILLASALGLAVVLGTSLISGKGFALTMSETVFMVAYYVGNLLALEAALRIAKRKLNASPR